MSLFLYTSSKIFPIHLVSQRAGDHSPVNFPGYSNFSPHVSADKLLELSFLATWNAPDSAKVREILVLHNSSYDIFVPHVCNLI